MVDYWNEARKKIEEFEGSVPWMYRNVAGEVAVGVGLLLPDAVAAGRLPFQVDGRGCTRDEVEQEFARVNLLPAGRPAQFYRRQGGPELSMEAMDSLLRSAVEDHVRTLTEQMKGFAALPDTAKAVVLDMAYSLGVDGLLTGFPEVMRAVETGAWRVAAAKSFRPGAGRARNQWTRAMLLKCAKGADGDGTAKRLCYGVVGMVASWMGR